jgi:hypothetical protein
VAPILIVALSLFLHAISSSKRILELFLTTIPVDHHSSPMKSDALFGWNDH